MIRRSPESCSCSWRRSTSTGGGGDPPGQPPRGCQQAAEAPRIRAHWRNPDASKIAAALHRGPPYTLTYVWTAQRQRLAQSGARSAGGIAKSCGSGAVRPPAGATASASGPRRGRERPGRRHRGTARPFPVKSNSSGCRRLSSTEKCLDRSPWAVWNHLDLGSYQSGEERALMEGGQSACSEAYPS
jgi:hypothetical protein